MVSYSVGVVCPLVGPLSFTLDPHLDGASIMWWCVSVGARFGLCWSSMDLFGSSLRVCIYRFDPSNVHFSSSTTVVVLVALVLWGFSTTSFRFLPQQHLSGSDEGGAMTAACLRFAPVLVVVSRWSADVIVILLLLLMFFVLP